MLNDNIIGGNTLLGEEVKEIRTIYVKQNNYTHELKKTNNVVEAKIVGFGKIIDKYIRIRLVSIPNTM